MDLKQTGVNSLMAQSLWQKCQFLPQRSY